MHVGGTAVFTCNNRGLYLFLHLILAIQVEALALTDLQVQQGRTGRLGPLSWTGRDISLACLNGTKTFLWS